jgi:hypothetical protein
VPGVKALSGHTSFAYTMTGSGPVSAVNKLGTQAASASQQRFLAQQKKQNYLQSQRASDATHQPKLIDKSLKTVLSGHNLMSLTQSTGVRHEAKE